MRTSTWMSRAQEQEAGKVTGRTRNKGRGPVPLCASTVARLQQLARFGRCPGGNRQNHAKRPVNRIRQPRFRRCTPTRQACDPFPKACPCLFALPALGHGGMTGLCRFSSLCWLAGSPAPRDGRRRSSGSTCVATASSCASTHPSPRRRASSWPARGGSRSISTGRRLVAAARRKARSNPFARVRTEPTARAWCSISRARR